MLTAQKERDNCATAQRAKHNSGLMRFATAQLAMVGWLAMTLPSTAQFYSSNNYYAYPYSYLSSSDFRACASRLVGVKLPIPATATACAQALSPQNLSRCVVDIKNHTNNTAVDALATCRQARRPTELADCVVNISRSTSRRADPADLSYCGNSLLPARFADCVVGLRRSLNLGTPTLALDTCISATDQLFDLSPTFVPQNGTASIPYPAPVTAPQNLSPTTPSNPVTPGGQ